MTPSGSKYLSNGNDNPDPMSNVKGAATIIGPIGGENKVKEVFCGKHPDKAIEYFCKQCNLVVCSKCMFLEHNGHELALLEDVTTLVRKNIFDLK